MPQVLGINSTDRTLIPADSGEQVTVDNRGPGTVYYGDKAVSSTANVGSIASGDSDDFSLAYYWVSASHSQLVVSPSGVTQDPVEIVSADYAAGDSYQAVAADLNLAATAGDSTDTSFLAAFMGNVLGAALTKTKNYLAGVIG